MPTEINGETLVNLKTAFGSTTGVAVTGTVTAVPQTSTTGTTTRVAASATNVTLQAANASRRGLTIYNNSVAANLFVKLGATANIGAGTESYAVRIIPGGYFEVPFFYTGIVDGIWDVAEAGAEALMTELT
jgi:hypothetical protein